MLFSESWLREFVNPDISSDELMKQLTMAGLEIGGFEAVANNFDKVVIGEVLSVEKHPDADKLSVCQVRVSENEIVQIVCGAPNVRAGMKAPVAMIGAKLSDDFTIKKSKLRGVESNGMLCAEEELGLAESSSGLMDLPENAPIGEDIRSYLKLDDAIIEVDLTPNRGDCLSIMGLARDLAALNNMSLTVTAPDKKTESIKDQLAVELLADDACPRYVGRVIKNINLAAKTPLWLKEKLRRGGIRSIDPVVDVTNFILLEMGQPMHAFDLNKLKGGIQVRMAKPSEKLTLLDGSELELREDSLVIADHEKALALAGIMGGLESGVTELTNSIFLESAFFAPLAIAGKARSYGLHTDSSHRFERGVDFNLQESAIERATGLLVEIVGGEVGPLCHAVNAAKLPATQKIHLRKNRLHQMLAMEIDDQTIESIFKNLGLIVEKENEGWLIKVPSHRFDLSIEVDLIEEVARVYGYNNLPAEPLNFDQKIEQKTETRISKSRFLSKLCDMGYQESVCYSFIDSESHKLFSPDAEQITLANPISSELSVMRSTLWSGLVKAAVFNQNRQQHALRLFEHGLVFNKNKSELTQVPKIAGLLTPKALPINWDGSNKALDFYDIKADVEALLAMSGQSYYFEPCEHPALHPGQSARIIKGGKDIGIMGAIHPQVAKSMDLDKVCYLFELDLIELQKKTLPVYKQVSRFPATTRDLAIVVDQQVTAQSLLYAAHQLKNEILREISIFDLYQGPNLGEGKKSIAITLRFQHDERTLEELEVTDFVDKMIKKLEQSFDAKLRD